MLKITWFTIISKSKFLNSSTIMRARRLQEAFPRSILPFWNQENTSSSQRWKTLAKVLKRLFIIVCSWDSIIAGFMEKFLRFKTRKWRRQFRWVSGATVVVMSENDIISIIFAFTQRWSFHYFIWPTARVIVALLRRWRYVLNLQSLLSSASWLLFVSHNDS